MTDAANIDANNIGVDLTGVTENRAAGGCNGNGDVYATDCYSAGGGEWGNNKVWSADGPFITRNEWHFVEAYFQLNTIENGIGIPNGVARYWLDGVLALDIQGVLFRTGAHPTMRFRQFVFAPYIGDGSPVTQTMWVDDIRVANRR